MKLKPWTGFSATNDEKASPTSNESSQTPCPASGRCLAHHSSARRRLPVNQGCSGWEVFELAILETPATIANMRSKQESTSSRPTRKRQPPCFRKACRFRFHSYLPQFSVFPKSSRTCIEGPFGEVIRATGPMAKANPFRFSTKYDDDESDLLYYGYRYYKPSTGTWPNRDPLGEKGGLNLYSFIGNSPIMLVDATGLMKVEQAGNGYDIIIGPATYHTGPDGGTVPVDFQDAQTAAGIDLGLIHVKGTATLSFLAIPQAKCKISAVPASYKSEWSSHFWPLPPSLTYTFSRSDGEALSESGAVQGTLNVGYIDASVSGNGTSKGREWGLKNCHCAQLEGQLGISMNIRVNYTLAFAPLLFWDPFAAAAGDEVTTELGRDLVFQ